MTEAGLDSRRRYLLEQDPILNGGETPRGDGHPIMPVPGLLRSDKDMREMRDYFAKEGYTSLESGIEKNREPGPHILNMISRLEKAINEMGQKATLIGVSLGGIYALVIGIMRPDLVQRVVLIGTATRKHVRDAANPRYKNIISMVIGGNQSYESFLHAIPTASIPPGIELISLHTRNDKVFNWEDCVDPRARLNIEVPDSHYDLHKSPRVFEIIKGVLTRASA